MEFGSFLVLNPGRLAQLSNAAGNATTRDAMRPSARMRFELLRGFRGSGGDPARTRLDLLPIENLVCDE